MSYAFLIAADFSVLHENFLHVLGAEFFVLVDPHLKQVVQLLVLLIFLRLHFSVLLAEILTLRHPIVE